MPLSTTSRILLTVSLLAVGVVVTAKPTFIRVTGSQVPFYCLPQPYEESVADGFNSESFDGRDGVLVDLKHDCDKPFRFRESENVAPPGLADKIKGRIAIIKTSNCPFSTFSEFYEDAIFRIARSVEWGATAAIVILENEGQPPLFVPRSTPIPVCLMDKQNGDALLSEFREGFVSLDIDPENLPLQTGESDDSELDVTFISVSNVQALDEPLPAWPSLFMDADNLDLEPVKRPVVFAVWKSECLVPEDAPDKFTRCQECWRLAHEDTAAIFENGDAFEDEIVVFHTTSDALRGIPRCFPEYHQVGLLAQELRAAAVIFSMPETARRPVFAGPASVPGIFGIPAFSILRSHAEELRRIVPFANVEATLPVFDEDLGFPLYLAAEGDPIPSATITIKVPKDKGGFGARDCDAGQALFGPEEGKALSSLRTIIGRPQGPCELEHGNGCVLGAESKDKVGSKGKPKGLVLFVEDFPFFHTWKQFVELAVDAGASALVLVNYDGKVYTMADPDNGVRVEIPVFNVKKKCGRQMVAAGQHAVFIETRETPSAQADALEVTLDIPEVLESVAASVGKPDFPEVLSLVDEEILELHNSYPLAQLRYSASKPGSDTTEGVIEVGQAAFNPLSHRGFTADLAAAEAIAECMDSNTDAGLSCNRCFEEMIHFKPVPPALSFENRVVLVRASSIHCLQPQDIVIGLSSQGAKAVIFANDGMHFRTLPRQLDSERTTIAAFNVMSDTAEQFEGWLADKFSVSADIPLVKQGEAVVCTSGDCLQVEASFIPVFEPFAGRNRSANTLTHPESGKSGSKDSGLPLKAIIAIAVAGGVLLLVVLVVIVVVVYRKVFGHKKYVDFDNAVQMSDVDGKPTQGGDLENPSAYKPEGEGGVTL